jgi:hypothetical protein
LFFQIGISINQQTKSLARILRTFAYNPKKPGLFNKA